MLKHEDLHYTGESTPGQGDKICRFANSWPERDYLDRHGVIARSREQLDAIEAVRGAIRCGVDHVPSEQLRDRFDNPTVYSSVTLPDIVGTVTIASWDGGLGWLVDKDGRVSRSSIRYEVDGDYNIYEVPRG